MNKLHTIAKSINILNCLLILAAAAVAYDVVIPYLSLDIRMALPALPKVATVQGRTAAPHASAPSPLYADYTIVSEQNLFHRERKIPQEKRDEKALDVPKPDLVLYGTLINDSLSIAYIEDRKAPYSTPGRANRQRQLKKGETIGGYVLRDVEEKRIVLVKGEEQIVVMLNDRSQRRTAETLLPATAASPVSSSTLPAAATIAPHIPSPFTPNPNAAAQRPVTIPSRRSLYRQEMLSK